MRVISIPLEIQEERARRAGVPLEIWQAQSTQRVSNMRVQAYRRAQFGRVMRIADLSDSQKRALRRMTLAFAEE